MRTTRAVLAAAFVLGLSSTFAAAVVAEEKPMRPGCGWIIEDGKYIFLGTCPDTTSDDADAPPDMTPAPT